MQDKALMMTEFDKWLIWFIVAIGSFLSTLSSSIVNVALPILSIEFAAPISQMQWIVTAYLLCICSTLPLFGWVGDKMQRSKLTALGFLMLALGSTMCSLAAQVSTLIAARVVQALGASMLMSNSYAIITNTFAVHQRARTLGMLGSAVALGSISGVGIGGFLIAQFNWPSIFLMNIPFSLLGCIMALLKIPRQEQAGSNNKIDIMGVTLFALFINAFIMAISSISDKSYSLIFTVLVFVASLVCLSLFLYHERKTTQPLVNLNMFKNSAFTSGNLAAFASFVAMWMPVLLLPYYMFHNMNISTQNIGFIMGLFPVFMLVSAPMSGYLSDRSGKPLMFSLIGIVLIALSLVMLVVAIDINSVVLLGAANAFMGFGNGMFQAPNNASTLSTIETKLHGVAGSITALVRNLGMIIGAAISIAVAEFATAQYLSRMPNNSEAAFVFGLKADIYVGIVAALCCFYFTWRKQGYMHNK